VVASSLVWDEGYPVEGGSALSRYLDDAPFRGSWFQAVGDTRDQSWSGLFRDADGNGVMEFAPVGTRLPSGRWTPELNALAWRPFPAKDAPQVVGDIPANTRLRLSVQWQEAHDPEFARHGEDVYRQPLATVNLVLLRQLDPTGQKQPLDDLSVVAESVSWPQRLDNRANAATYEQTLEFVVKEPGRYLVRLEGQAPLGTRPAGEATLPSQRRMLEIRPRLFVRTLEGPGRAVFADYTSTEGLPGMPTDAQHVCPLGEHP
jgi:hypothetical protein